ncbi:MAG: CoA transferase subunit A [Dehalococcoidia bacterium]
MSSKVCSTFAEAVQEIPNGASILVGGFGPGTPWNLLAALYHQGATDLTMIANNAISPAVLQNADGMVTHTTLIEAGRVRRFIASFTAGAHPSQPSPVEALAAAGKLEAELVPQGTLAERIRAGGAGIPAFYTPTGAGTEIARGKEQRDFNGRTYLLEEAITADYAFLRAWKADTFGNLVFRLAQRNYNPIMAMAARCTIVEVEEPIVAEGELDPDHVHTSGIFVQHMIEIPPPPEGVLHVARRGAAAAAHASAAPS